MGAKEAVTLANRIVACEAGATISNGIKGLDHATWVAAVQLVTSAGCTIPLQTMVEIAEFRCGQLGKSFFSEDAQSETSFEVLVGKLVLTSTDDDAEEETVLERSHGTVLDMIETERQQDLQNDDDDDGLATASYNSKLEAMPLSVLISGNLNLTLFQYCLAYNTCIVRIRMSHDTERPTVRTYMIICVYRDVNYTRVYLFTTCFKHSEQLQQTLSRIV
jgi:hypothetical protein